MNWISDKLATTLREVHGEKGEAWLRNLPDLLKHCEQRFGVTLEEPFSNLSYNLVVKATWNDGTPVVLKFGVEALDVFNELAALRAYAGRGSIAVVDADESHGVLVLQRVLPGVPLSTIEDDQRATEIFVDVCRRLHCPPPAAHHFPSIADWAKGLVTMRNHFGGGTGPLPEPLVERAEACFAELIATTQEVVLLHGDLHHENILLQGENEWTVIDPKGIVGDPYFGTIQYLLNHTDRGGDPESVLRRRLQILSTGLGMNPRRIASWGLAQSVLSAWWTIEDHGQGWEGGIADAERFARWLDSDGATSM